MKSNTSPQKASEKERKTCSHCFILMATHEQGMVTVPAVMKGNKEISPEKYYHAWHAPKEPPVAVSIAAALHDPANVQSAPIPIQA